MDYDFLKITLRIFANNDVVIDVLMIKDTIIRKESNLYVHICLFKYKGTILPYLCGVQLNSPRVYDVIGEREQKLPKKPKNQTNCELG